VLERIGNDEARQALGALLKEANNRAFRQAIAESLSRLKVAH